MSWNNATKADFEDGKGNPKFATFRLTLPFVCDKDFAGDLEHPGVIFRTIDKQDGSKRPILYIECKSAYKLVNESKQDVDLKSKEFVSPPRASSKSTPTGHAAVLLEALFASGMKLEDIKKNLRASGDADEMNIDGAFESYKKRKQGWIVSRCEHLTVMNFQL